MSDPTPSTRHTPTVKTGKNSFCLPKTCILMEGGDGRNKNDQGDIHMYQAPQMKVITMYHKHNVNTNFIYILIYKACF